MEKDRNPSRVKVLLFYFSKQVMKLCVFMCVCWSVYVLKLVSIQSATHDCKIVLVLCFHPHVPKACGVFFFHCNVYNTHNRLTIIPHSPLSAYYTCPCIL